METSMKMNDLLPQKAQTGPAVRNDVNVINKHLSMLEDAPDIYDIYKQMSESIYKFYIEET
jgi:hypothetical protein